MAEIPGYADSLYDIESGRAELYFDDVAFGRSRTIVVSLSDPACWDGRGTRGALFQMLLVTLSNENSNQVCEDLRAAIRAGFVKLGRRTFDLRPAQPFLGEVCPT